VKPGDALVVLGMLLWLTLKVGPWWAGVELIMAASLLNWLTRKDKAP
jgi:hypothetical protein